MGYGNFRATKLSADIAANTNSFKIDVLPRDSSNNIITSGRLVLEPRNSDKREIIKFTGVDTGTTTLTGVLRGQGGTTATTHSKGAAVEMNITAEDLEEALAVPNNLAQYERDLIGDYVVDGSGIIVQTAGLVGSFANIQYYINGFRYTKTGIPNKTYTPSKDTYVFIDIAGVVTYTEVSNGATAPTIPANNFLVALVVTDASNITTVYQDGTITNIGDMIYRTRNAKNYRQVKVDTMPNQPATTSSSYVTINGGYPITLKTRTGKLLVRLHAPLSVSANNGQVAVLINGTYYDIINTAGADGRGISQEILIRGLPKDTTLTGTLYFRIGGGATIALIQFRAFSWSMEEV